MIKSYSSDFVLPISSPPLKNGVISVNEGGEIVGVYSENSPETQDLVIEKLQGVITPGFVNTHCHLELSHLEKKVDRNLTLIPFIEKVISLRGGDPGDIRKAMKKADEDMLNNGIVAVGDICNTSISKDIKTTSKVFYHSFIEMICFEPEKVKDVFREHLDIKDEFGELVTSVSPHAPYSACKELFRYFSRFCNEYGNILSLHNQESEEENKLYRYKTGGFVDFYRRLGKDIGFFRPQARNSIQSILPLFPAHQRIILVHNTYTSLKDVYFVRRFGHDIYWCFCPNANLYIEGRLPKIDMFQFQDFKITLGTDSLASNDQLCILSELKTLAKHFPAIPLTTTLTWATQNGAKLFNIDEKFGTLETGKSPGLNLITHMEGLNLTEDSKVRKLA